MEKKTDNRMELRYKELIVRITNIMVLGCSGIRVSRVQGFGVVGI